MSLNCTSVGAYVETGSEDITGAAMTLSATDLAVVPLTLASGATTGAAGGPATATGAVDSSGSAAQPPGTVYFSSEDLGGGDSALTASAKLFSSSPGVGGCRLI